MANVPHTQDLPATLLLLLACQLVAQVFKDGEPEQGWRRLQDRTEALLAEAPPPPVQGVSLGAAGKGGLADGSTAD